MILCFVTICVIRIVTVSPTSYNASETLCSLRFADKCRSVALGSSNAAKATWEKATKKVSLITSSTKTDKIKSEATVVSPTGARTRIVRKKKVNLGGGLDGFFSGGDF